MNRCFLNITPCDDIKREFSLYLNESNMPYINGQTLCDYIFSNILSQGCGDRTIYGCISISGDSCNVAYNPSFSGCALMSITSEPQFIVINCESYTIDSLVLFPCNEVSSCKLCSCRSKNVYTLSCCNDTTRQIDVIFPDGSNVNVGDVIEISNVFGCFIVSEVFNSLNNYPEVNIIRKHTDCNSCNRESTRYEKYNKVKEFIKYYPVLNIPCNLNEVNSRICNIIKIRNDDKMLRDYKIRFGDTISSLRRKVNGIIRWLIFDYELKYKEDCCGDAHK